MTHTILTVAAILVLTAIPPVVIFAVYDWMTRRRAARFYAVLDRVRADSLADDAALDAKP